MTPPLHRWLADAIAPAFAVRYPWADALRRAVATAECACAVFPRAAGELDEWALWLEGELDAARPALALGPTARHARDALLHHTGVREDDLAHADWPAALPAVARRATPHVDPVPLIVIDPDHECATALARLLAAQRDINYPLARPVLVCRAVPRGWPGEAIRFGPPEPVGDLCRPVPPPGDRDFWTHALLALAATWEAGAVPARADELWEQLTLDRALTPRDAGFDRWLERQLTAFARGIDWTGAPEVADVLAFGPVRPAPVHEAAWHAGALSHANGWFDLTPTRARGWLETLNGADRREAVTRRRLVNAPLARWLAAWAASVEEGLRVLAVRSGRDKFRAFLQSEPPRRRDRGFANRLEEFAPEDIQSLAGAAEFGDLTRFLTHVAPPGSRTSVSALLDRCRDARNRVIHQREVTASCALALAATVDWLASEGLL